MAQLLFLDREHEQQVEGNETLRSSVWGSSHFSERTQGRRAERLWHPPAPLRPSRLTSSIPRGHWIEENTRAPIPILTLIGGKLTTCRALAEEVADRVLSQLRMPRIASSRDRYVGQVSNLPGQEQSGAKEPRTSSTGQVENLPHVRDIIRHEWVRTLSDLVERRLLLIFDPTFDLRKLREMATLLADEEVIRPDQIDSEIAAVATRLRQFYGLDLDGS